MPRRTIPLLSLLFAVLIAGGFAWRSLAGQPATEALSPGELRPAAQAQAGLHKPAAGPLPSFTQATKREALGAGQHAGQLLGRSLTYMDSEPLAGVVVNFFRGPDPIAQATSDLEGHFSVELPAGGFETADIQAPLGWWCVKHGVIDGTYRVLLASTDVGPLHALLLDQGTGQRVPNYILRVEDSLGWSEALRSDATGRLESEMLFTRGPLAIHVLAEELGGGLRGYLSSTLEHAPDGWNPPLASIRLQVGPTYRLELDNPGGLALNKLRAFLTSAAQVDRILEAPQRAMYLRSGDPAWVRFPRPMPWLEDPQLVITGAGGQWQGSAAVQTTAGIQSEPVHVHLERRLRVKGRVFKSEGQPTSRADVELIPVRAARAARARGTSTNGRGLFILKGVRPGHYELFVRHAREGMAHEVIELTEEHHDGFQLKLEPYPVAGDVAGVVRSLSGEFRGDLTVSLTVLGKEANATPMRSIRIAWEEVGAAYEGRFRFEGVGQGQYTIGTFLRRANFDVSPAVQRVNPPDEALELLVRDDRPRYRLDFMVLDAESGEWLSQAQARIRDANGKLAYKGPAMGWNPARMFADGEPIQWSVEFKGYRSRSGGRAQFDALHGEGSHIATIKLEKQ